MKKSKKLKDQIENDLLTIGPALHYNELSLEEQDKCKKIHKTIVALKLYTYDIQDDLPKESQQYLNEVISDLIEAYHLLFNDRYKTSKIMIRSSIDCLIKGIHCEWKINEEYTSRFTDNLKVVNKTLKEYYDSRSIPISFLDKLYDEIKKIFDDTSGYVHSKTNAELSQYQFINEIINPDHSPSIRIQHVNEMLEYIETILFYLVISNVRCILADCSLEKQNVIYSCMTKNRRKILELDIKEVLFP
ncbi:hypothetical protein [Lysinibacillus xylanilyticus]|uniref:hypothetical protein n=1 Tax=Lysinibacillus xylanilyticus TaxID=582475 RepID=UPI0037F5A821